PGQVDLQAGLLERLAHGAVGHGLAKVHEPARKRPQPTARVDRTPREEDGAVLLGNGRGHDLGVQVEDEPAARADFLLTVVGRHRLDREGGAAEGAEADRRGGQDGVVAHASESKPAILGATMADGRQAAAAALTPRAGGCYKPTVAPERLA